MNVLIDTSVWSLVFRRRLRVVDRWTLELIALVRERRAVIIGAVRQELLSGIHDAAQFDQMRLALRAFPDQDLYEDDYEQGASFYNRCRARGIQGSTTDLLICAVASRLSLSILTTDRDFDAFENVLPIKLHELR